MALRRAKWATVVPCAEHGACKGHHCNVAMAQDCLARKVEAQRYERARVASAREKLLRKWGAL